jgi:hypothetical protein
VEVENVHVAVAARHGTAPLYLDLICEYLWMLREHKLTRLIVNVPPQTMKSRLCTIMFPV